MTSPVIPLTNAPDLVKTTRLDVATGGTTGAYTYTQVKGIKALNEANSYTTQDTSTFDTGNRGTDMPTQFKKVYTGTLQKFVAEDATHTILRTAGDGLTLIGVRIYDRNGGPEAHEGTAFVQWEPQGGDGAAIKTNNFTLFLQDWEEITNPLTTAAVPTLTSALPTGQAAGEWIEIVGVGFVGTVSASIGGVAIVTRDVISDTRMLVKLPAGSAGAQPLIVTNATGPSTSLSYTRA